MESRLCTVPFLRISTASCAYKAATLSACPALNSCTQVSRIFCMTAAKSSGSSVECFVEDLVGDWDCVTAAEGSSNNTIKTVNAVLRGSSINPSYDAQMRSNPGSIVTQTFLQGIYSSAFVCQLEDLRACGFRVFSLV